MVVVALLGVGSPAHSVAQTTDPAARLRALVAEEWELRLHGDPLLATAVGRHDWDDHLPDVSPAAERRRAADDERLLGALRELPAASLGTSDRVTHGMLVGELEDRLAGHRLGESEIPFNSDSGFFSDLARLPSQMPMGTAVELERYVARLHEVPRYFEQQTENLRRGMRRGMTLPRVVLDGPLATLARFADATAEESPFFAPFRDLAARFPASEAAQLRAIGLEAVEGSVLPAFRQLLRFVADEYLPAARRGVAAAELPDGAALYRHWIQRYTTLELEPAALHDLGRREVTRIEEEMRQVARRIGFAGELAELIEQLRTDPRFYVDDPARLLERAAFLAKRMEGQLPRLFRTLPRLPYTVEPVPEQLAASYTGGRYVPAAWGSTEPGRYWVNTHALDTRPLYNLEALTLHEAVPGHHLQIALAQERNELPPFRRAAYHSAFGEGWALYAERLGLEAGFYQDPTSDLGRLTYEMWRACRLVVDTGLHAFGWTRQQAIAYLEARTALSHHEIETEVDRYISWPAQALSYKVGELEIRRLRGWAEERLGERFDLRDFHDAVLLQGSVPLPVLAELVEAWVESVGQVRGSTE